MKKLVFTLFLFLVNACYGAICLEPGKYALEAEFLLLHPSLDDTFFIIDSTTGAAPNGERENNRFKLKPAVRLEFAHAVYCSPNELHVSWTHFNGQRRHTVFTNPTGFPTQSILLPLVIAGEAFSKIDFHFNSLTGFYQRKIYCCGPLSLSFRFGIQFARIHVEERVFLSDSDSQNIEDDTFRQKMRALGPEMGLAGNFFLCNNFCRGSLALTFLTWGGLLGSFNDSKFTFITNNIFANPFTTRNETLWRIIPAWHARMGISYTGCTNWLCCKGGHFSLEAGYEFTTYRQAVSKLRFEGAFGQGFLGKSFNYYSSFDLQGPYFAANLVF